MLITDYTNQSIKDSSSVKEIFSASLFLIVPVILLLLLTA